jgi:hypothetical protein
VINQATETRIRILEIAELVQRLAAERGIHVELNRDLDPRHERARPASSGPARNLRLRRTGIPTIPLEDGVRQLMDDVSRHSRTLSPAEVPPTVDWATGAAPKLAAAG